MNIIKWIEQGLKESGKTVTGLGLAVCGDKTVGTKILNGTRQVKAQELIAIAEYIGASSIPLLDDESIQLETKPTTYYTPEFRRLLLRTIEIGAREYPDVPSEQVLRVAETVYEELKDESDTAKEKAIKAAMSAVAGV